MAGALFQADGILAWVVYNGFRLSRLPSRQGLNLPGGSGHLSLGKCAMFFTGVPPFGGGLAVCPDAA